MLIINVVKIIHRKSPWRLANSPQTVKRNFSIIPNSRIVYENLAIKQGNSNRNLHAQQDKSEGGAGRTIIFTIGTIALVGGGTLAYAKYDAEFRKTLALYVPYTETILTNLENNSITNLYGSAKKSIISLISNEDEKTTIKELTTPEPKEYKAPPSIIPILEKEVKPKSENYTEVRIKDKTIGKDEQETNIVKDAKPKPKDVNFESLTDLERKVGETSAEAINAYNKAASILSSYNQDIEQIIDEAVNEIKPELWENIRRKTKSKNEYIKKAHAKAEEAEKDAAKLKDLISRPDFDVPENTKLVIRQHISKVRDDVTRARKQMKVELDKGRLNEKYWDKIERARRHFSDELEILFPNIDISKKKLAIERDQIDLFVLHVYATVLFYQKELAKLETLLQNKVNKAVESAKKGDLEPLTDAQVCEAVEQEKRRLNASFQQRILKLKKEADAELREQLKRQSQAFNDHLNEAIKIRETEIDRDLNRKFDEQLEEERCKFKLQLSAMVGRLQGLDEGIKARNDADASSKQAQVLWSACQSLLRAVKAGCPGLPWKDQIRSLEPEINAVVKAAAPNDELVSVIVQSIPKEAKVRGVYPEDALRERFFKVEKLARTLDLIPAEGASLPVHILSYLQSLLLIKKPSSIPQAELNDEEVDFSKLTTNHILQRARYWLDRGDFVQALKYMNLLQGAPRSIARQWMNETRILLETQQAANTLMAHAASSGLIYL